MVDDTKLKREDLIILIATHCSWRLILRFINAAEKMLKALLLISNQDYQIQEDKSLYIVLAHL